MKNTFILAVFLMVIQNLYSDTYTRTYSPVSGNVISSSGFMGELDAIGTVVNGNLDSNNVKNGSLKAEDFLSNDITSDKIKDDTIEAADIKNLGSIAKGSIVVATATSTLGEHGIGTVGQYLTTDGTDLTWTSPSSSGWTDSGTAVYPDSVDDNVVIGGTAAGTSAKGVLAIYNNTVPSASITNGVQLYAEDVNSSSELKVRDEAGNVTTLSPHNFTLIPKERLDEYELPFSFYSKNEIIGKEINVDMYGAIKEVERLSGKQFIFISKINRKELKEQQLSTKPEWVRNKVKKEKEKEGK